MRSAVILLACLAAAVAAPGAAVVEPEGRLAGAAAATINQYPFSAALLFSYGTVYSQACVGTIVSARSVLTAAHCLLGDVPSRWRMRIGSAWANSGGTVLNTAMLILHPSFNTITRDSDIALLRSATNIAYITGTVQPASIAGANYNLPDNQIVWTSGWGSAVQNGAFNDQLRHVQVWTVNQITCRERMRFSVLNRNVSDNMLCSGWLDVGGRGQCSGGAGSPLLHNGVLVGVYSWGVGCGLARYPDVNTRVSRFTQWITTNA